MSPVLVLKLKVPRPRNSLRMVGHPIGRSSDNMGIQGLLKAGLVPMIVNKMGVACNGHKGGLDTHSGYGSGGVERRVRT